MTTLTHNHQRLSEREARLLRQDASGVDTENLFAPAAAAEAPKNPEQRMKEFLEKQFKSKEEVKRQVQTLIDQYNPEVNENLQLLKNSLARAAQCLTEVEKGENYSIDLYKKALEGKPDEEEQKAIDFINTIDIDGIRKICEAAGLYQENANPKSTTEGQSQRISDIEKKLSQKPPALPMEQAVLRREGKYILLRGIFEKTGNEYKLWASNDVRNTRPHEYITINARDLEETPGEVTAIRNLSTVSMEPYSGMRVAINEDGRQSKGIFELDGLGQYKWWKSARERERNPNDYMVLVSSKLRQLPIPAPGKEKEQPQQKQGKDESLQAEPDQELEQKLSQEQPVWQVERAVLNRNGNRVLLQGVFELDGNAYKLWKSSEDRNAHPDKYITFQKKDIETIPGDVPEIKNLEQISMEPYEGKRVATMKDGTKIEGIFELDNIGQYKVWRSANHRNKDPNGYSLYTMDQLQKLPIPVPERGKKQS